MRRLVEQVILHNARPTLVVPYAGSFTTIGDTVAIAWDDSREAARAVADALPILHKAQKVHLIQYESANDDITNQELHQRLKSVQQWLSWHGVEAEARLESPPANVGHALLAALNDVGADLLVMGAYGHTRWTERIFGGVTQTLLTQMTTPVLMSH
jgi:nucleotide-binding universal stress UspA family protein